MPTRRFLAFVVLLLTTVAGTRGIAAADKKKNSDKEIEQWKSSTWQMAIALDAPHLDPPAVQYAMLDEDPVAGFTARVKRMQSYYREQIDRAKDENRKSIARSSGMTVSWDLGFKDVTGDEIYLLTSAPDKSHSLSSNGPDGKKWVVTKTVSISAKPVCWCLPVEVKTGKQIKVTLSESNQFDLASAFARAMGEKGEAPESKGPAEATAEKKAAAGEPLALDLARFYGKDKPDQYAANILEKFFGKQLVDGLPFEIHGQVRLWGQTVAERNPNSGMREQLKGICVGRRFDELHLIHYAMWPDVEGETVAFIELNYADGTRCIFPICYGAQVSDWYDLPSYETKLPTDPDTKICWRRGPANYKAPVRLFKSKLTNPMPQKVVETMDVVSARHLSTYTLLAATVANRNPQRPITPPAPASESERKFDSEVTIKAVDAATGKTIENALVEPSIGVVGEWLVGPPFYTSAAGEGTIHYPAKDTTHIAAFVKKEGYRAESSHWSGTIPGTYTFRLTSEGGAVQERSIFGKLQDLLSPSPKPAAAPKGAIRPLFLLDADGGNLHRFASPPEYTSCGSPEWSRDGKKIAFDAWRSSAGEDYSRRHVFVASVDGRWIEDLGPGGMPSWSPDGRQIAFSHWYPSSGVSIMNADGSNRQLIDAEGWGAEWSPKRNEVAYVVSPRGGQKLCIYDLKTKDRCTLLGDQDFQYVRQGFTWSPDGEHLCFKGILGDNTAQIDLVYRKGKQNAFPGFMVLLPSTDVPNVGGGSPTLSWGGNGRQVLFSIKGKNDRSVQIYLIDVADRQPPKLMPGQDPGRDNVDVAWSPDGKRIVFASQASKAPAEKQ